ncbi:WDR75 family protein [Megaselia abdita]
MDIVAQNRLSDETSKILYDIRVTAADINIDWLATGEEFNDMEHTPEVRLKFWEYQKNTQNYALNTNFEIPHDGGFRLIKFSSPLGSDNLVCATVGLDNVLKVWALEDSDNIYKQGKTWGCVKKITYKYQPIESVSFSNDGSLLAAGFANNLCIYMVKNMELKFVLSTPSSYSGLINECFIGLPKEKSKKTTDNRKTILQSFIKSLESGDDKFVKSLSSDKKSPKPLNLNEKSKPNLHKQILQSSDLGFFQKILTFKKLSIPSKFSDKTVADKVLHRFNGKSHSLSKKLKQVPHKMQFKAKHKLNRLLPTHSNKFDEVASLLQFLNISKKSGQMNGFSNGVDKDDSSEIKTIPKETKKIVQIKHICFCSGEYAHLVVVCTENRVFIWNLLTLRLQNILKLSVEHVTFDPITNLIACFTRYNECELFSLLLRTYKH